MSDCVDQMSEIKYNSITEIYILTQMALCCKNQFRGVRVWGFGLPYQIQVSSSERMALL